MRRLLCLLCASTLTACATVGRPPATGGAFSNSEATGIIRLVDPAAGGTVTTTGGSGDGGSGGSSGPTPKPGTTPTPAPSPKPGTSPTPAPRKPSGSELLATVAVDARREPGKEYAPLMSVNLAGDVFYWRWKRASFYPVAGVREFTATELSLLGQAVAALNAAIGQSDFELRIGSAGDIPITNESEPGAGYAGYAQHDAVTPEGGSGGTLGRFPDPRLYYVTEKIMINFGTLPPTLPDYPEYFRHVALHEMGHVAGLAHNPHGGVMNTKGDSTSYKSAGFSESERRTLALITGTPTD